MLNDIYILNNIVYVMENVCIYIGYVNIYIGEHIYIGQPIIYVGYQYICIGYIYWTTRCVRYGNVIQYLYMCYPRQRVRMEYICWKQLYILGNTVYILDICWTTRRICCSTYICNPRYMKLHIPNSVTQHI